MRSKRDHQDGDGDHGVRDAAEHDERGRGDERRDEDHQPAHFDGLPALGPNEVLRDAADF